jgi:hypothetical protein
MARLSRAADHDTQLRGLRNGSRPERTGKAVRTTFDEDTLKAVPMQRVAAQFEDGGQI